MPRIQVIKHGKNLIPVRDTVTRTARECPFTGKLFLSRGNYRKHLIGLRDQHRRQRAANQLFIQLQNQPSLDHVFEFIQDNPDVIWYNDPQWLGKYSIEFQLLAASYSLRETCSNTHAAPRNGMINWGGYDDHQPRGYPGYAGRIRFCITTDLPGHYTSSATYNRLRRIGIHLHSGGGVGKGTAEYDSTIFLDDFPTMKTRLGIRQTMNRIQNTEPFTHQWTWHSVKE